jgi:hypothetical protein
VTRKINRKNQVDQAPGAQKEPGSVGYVKNKNYSLLETVYIVCDEGVVVERERAVRRKSATAVPMGGG